MFAKLIAFLKSIFQKSEPTYGSENNKVVRYPTEPVEQKPAEPEYFGAPWVFANLDLLGKEETDKALNARYVPEWKLEGLNYKTLAGNEHAWCSLCVNADFRKVGIKGTNSAAASSWSTWGQACDFVFGAALPIEHQGGGRHVCRFLYWIDAEKGLACTLDGNKGNHFGVNVTNLSPGHDKVKSSPRWPIGYPAGKHVTKEEVIAKYPMLVPGKSNGGSTT